MAAVLCVGAASLTALHRHVHGTPFDVAGRSVSQAFPNSDTEQASLGIRYLRYRARVGASGSDDCENCPAPQ
jgi:hypothetical protein